MSIDLLLVVQTATLKETLQLSLGSLVKGPVMFLMIKVRTHIGVLASGLLTISGLVSTISVSSNCH